jgi:hypothetical protein
MPMVTVSLLAGRRPAWRRAILDGIHDAIVAAGFPVTDRFQRVLEFGPDDLAFRSTHPDLRTARTQAFGPGGDSVIARQPGISPTDVMIVSDETAMRDRSFAAG